MTKMRKVAISLLDTPYNPKVALINLACGVEC